MDANTQFEHRWGHRKALDAVAEMQTTDGVSVEVSIENASLSGAFIVTTFRLPLLTHVFLRAATIDGEWLDGFVVRVEERGLAVEWLDPGLKPYSTLLAREKPKRRS